MRKVFEQIQHYPPKYTLIASNISDSYLKKRDLLVKKIKQFLDHDSDVCLNSDGGCEKLLAKIKELSKEISMYYEMCKYREKLYKISSSIQRYAGQLKKQHHKSLPQTAAQLYEAACGMQNDQKYLNYKKRLDRQIKKLQTAPNKGAPNPVIKDFMPQPRVIIVKKVPKN